MNVLFVNYGNFTTNSLNHIAGFASWLASQGHACVVAVPGEKETLSVVAQPVFTAATYAEVLARPACFPNHRPADLIHAWTPREGVRKFVAAYQRLRPGTRVLVHLEDNEDYLLEAFGGRPLAELRELPEQKFPYPMVDGLSHPVRYHHLLRLADGITVIHDRLREFAPPDKPVHLLRPGVDFSFFRPEAAASGLRGELGLKPGEKVVVFIGSVTYANAAEMRELYTAVRRLNDGGTPVRLVRTGFTLPGFTASLGFETPWLVELGFLQKERLPALLALADVLVQPGRPGPFNDYRLPSKLPEYLAAGRPVVLPASNIGLELADGREALVLANGDAEAIAAACRRVFADAALAARLGAGGRAFAQKHFDLAANSAGLLAFYEKISAAPPNPIWRALEGTRETELPAVLAQLSAQLAAAPLPPSANRTELLAALADATRAVRQLDTDLAERAITIRDLRRHAAGLEETRDKLSAQFREVRAHAAEHARQLQEEIAKGQKDFQRAEQAVVKLHDELYQSEYRVLRMRSTLSWRVTSLFRSLRKALNPLLGPPAQPPPPPLPPNPLAPPAGAIELRPPSPAFSSHLDTPHRWPLEATDLPVRGWVVAKTGVIHGIRARIGERIFPGQCGLGRPDVAQNFKHVAKAGHSGFRLTVSIAATDETIDLEAQDDGGHWHVFYSQRLGQNAQPALRGTYDHWLQEFDPLRPEALETLRRRAATFANPPLISVLMPVYNTPEKWLVRAIESVRAQVYPHWELCLADDASTQPHVRAVLERYAAQDPRIKPVYRGQNGHISAASNTALQAATGVFCALFDHDDELAPAALFCVAEQLLLHPDAEVVYTDEDKIDETGHRFDPHFKPDWNPDFLTSQNYLSHLTVYRTATLRTIGGFREGFEGAQDWDLAFRVTERVQPAQILHIPRVLYHWRAIEGSTAMQFQEKDYTSIATRRAIEEHLARRGEKAVLEPSVRKFWRARRIRPEPAPLVTLVIPTRNRRDLLISCVTSIRAKTDYPNYEILIADNESDDPELLAFYDQMKAAGRFEVLPCPGKFNYSAINNRAVRYARGELVALLNNDLEAIDGGWLDELVSQAVRPEIGCVGAKLYYPDGHIQHAGVITGLGGAAGHAYKGYVRDEMVAPALRPHMVQNLSAVTAACLVIRKAIYEQVGGLDEEFLPVSFNDVDFCLKVQAAGYRNLFTPFAELIHHESASRGAEDTPAKIVRAQGEVAILRSRWGAAVLENDPAYNPNLTLDSEDFGLAYPPRVPPLV
ncbi:MAG TPA: glycosyltransferase [Lacunisphaera sp.]|nr:glycosyltransferase [Lacunisphaera sp.]